MATITSADPLVVEGDTATMATFNTVDGGHYGVVLYNEYDAFCGFLVYRMDGAGQNPRLVADNLGPQEAVKLVVRRISDDWSDADLPTVLARESATSTKVNRRVHAVKAQLSAGLLTNEDISKSFEQAVLPA